MTSEWWQVTIPFETQEPNFYSPMHFLLAQRRVSVNELQGGSDGYGDLKVHPSHISCSHPLHLSSFLPTASDSCPLHPLNSVPPCLWIWVGWIHTANQTSLPLRGGAHFPATEESQLSFHSKSVFLTLSYLETVTNMAPNFDYLRPWVPFLVVYSTNYTIWWVDSSHRDARNSPTLFQGN